jgi:hypothetical protein
MSYVVARCGIPCMRDASSVPTRSCDASLTTHHSSLITHQAVRRVALLAPPRERAARHLRAPVPNGWAAVWNCRDKLCFTLSFTLCFTRCGIAAGLLRCSRVGALQQGCCAALQYVRGVRRRHL